MPTIIVRATTTDGRPAALTLVEWVLPVHLQDAYYADQLVDRLGWAVVDAVSIEADLKAAGEPVLPTGQTEREPTR
jgi:hypothetical protein